MLETTQRLFFFQLILQMDKKFERISRKKVREMCKKDVKHVAIFKLLFRIEKYHQRVNHNTSIVARMLLTLLKNTVKLKRRECQGDEMSVLSNSH